jgi:hypothetical protein
VPSVRALPTLVVVPGSPSQPSGDQLVLIGGLKPNAGYQDGVVNPPADAVWTASVTVTAAGSYSLDWTMKTVVGAVPPVGVWGGSCVISNIIYVFTEVSECRVGWFVRHQ